MASIVARVGPPVNARPPPPGCPPPPDPVPVPPDAVRTGVCVDAGGETTGFPPAPVPLETAVFTTLPAFSSAVVIVYEPVQTSR